MPENLRVSLRLTADSKGFVGGVQQGTAAVDRMANRLAIAGQATQRLNSEAARLSRGMAAAGQATRRFRTDAERLTSGLDRAGQATTRQISASARLAFGMRQAANAQRAQAAATRDATAAAGNQDRSLLALHGRIAGYTAGLGALAYVTARVTRALTRQLDAYTELNNRLRLVTDSEASLAAVRGRLLGISQATRSALAENTKLYSRIALSAEETGHSQSQLLRVTELLNKQVLIGGNTATEAAAGLVQFAQGLASGRLQGDELRSVMENLLGVQQGLLTGFRILRERGQIDFDVTRANIRDLAAEGVLSSRLLLDAILASADDTEQKYRDVEITVSGATQKLSNAFLLLFGRLDEVTGASESLAESLSNVADDITSGLDRGITDIYRDIDDVRRNIDNTPLLLRLIPFVDESYRNQLAALYQEIADLRAATPAGNQVEGHAPVRHAEPVRRAGLTAPSAFEVLSGAAQPHEASRRQAAEALAAHRRATEAAATAAAEQERAAERQQAIFARRLRALDQQINKTLELSTVEQLRREIAAGALGELSRAEQDLLLHKAAVIDESIAQAEAERARRRAADEAARALAEAERARLDAIGEINRANRNRFDQARADLEAWRQETLSALKSNAAAYEQYADDVEEIVSRRQAEIATEEADHRLRESERWQDGARRALEDYARAATDAAQNVQQAVTSGLQSMEDALVDFVTTGKLNFRSLVDSILADLARLVVRQAITGPLSQALGGLFGGGGLPPPGTTPGFGGFANSLAGAPVFHRGGLVGAPGGLHRQVDRQVFDGAARYHRGGIAGNEVPAILERGEVVLSRQHVAALGQAGTQPPPVEINFENRGTPQRPVEQDTRFDGRRWVISVVLDDLNSRGEISQGIGRQFGLREATV